MYTYSSEKELRSSCLGRSLGMKWYFFFVKIRPWYEIVITALWLITTLPDTLVYWLESYNRKALGIILLSLAYAFILIVLQFRVFISSIVEINKLVKCIENLLTFEICVLAYRWGEAVQGIAGVFVWIVIMLLGFFAWYNPNLKYFAKRLCEAPNNAPTQSASMPKDVSTISEEHTKSDFNIDSAIFHDMEIVASAPVITNITPPISQEKPMNRPYSANLIHQTLKNGEYVRSKSEVIIANMLFEAGIPYEYEKELDLGTDGIRFPDFTIELSHNGKRFFWEHCGMMNDLRYQKKWEVKKELYRKHNIIEGKNLIITQDLPNGGIDSSEIKRIINTYLR